MEIKHINPENMAKPRGYSHAISVTGNHRTIYIGGQNAIDENGKSEIQVLKDSDSNDKGAKMKWTGKVTGDKIYGTTTLYEQGKAPVIYWFKGKLSA